MKIFENVLNNFSKDLFDNYSEDSSVYRNKINDKFPSISILNAINSFMCLWKDQKSRTLRVLYVFYQLYFSLMLCFNEYKEYYKIFFPMHFKNNFTLSELTYNLSNLIIFSII